MKGQLVLTLGGKARTLFFDYFFLSILNALVPQDELEAYFESNPFSIIPLLTYCGLKSGEDINDLPEGFSERVASRWLRDVSPQDSAQIMEEYKEAMGFIQIAFSGLIASTQAVSEKPKSGVKQGQ